MSTLALPDHTIAAYAQQAFALVLEEHELFIQPSEVSVTTATDGSLALSYEKTGLTATGAFRGNLHESTLALGCVMTPAWETQFDSVDTFKGCKPDGSPCLRTKPFSSEI